MSRGLPKELSHPSTPARMTATGRQVREKPIYSQNGGSREDFTEWEVEVTPLRDMTSIGRSLTGGRWKPRATFEIRATYYGTGLPEFGSQPNTRLSPRTHTEDVELAQAIARALEQRLRQGEREFDFFAIARAVEHRQL